MLVELRKVDGREALELGMGIESGGLVRGPALLQLHPGSMPAMLSTMYCMRSWRTASGRPMRATRTPARDSPSTKLSTAMLLSEVHRMGQVRDRSHICTYK